MEADLIKRLVEIYGCDYVLDSPEAIELYSRCTIPWSRMCGAVVLPKSVDQISRIVRFCSEFRTTAISAIFFSVAFCANL